MHTVVCLLLLGLLSTGIGVWAFVDAYHLLGAPSQSFTFSFGIFLVYVGVIIGGPGLCLLGYIFKYRKQIVADTNKP